MIPASYSEREVREREEKRAEVRQGYLTFLPILRRSRSPPGVAVGLTFSLTDLVSHNSAYSKALGRRNSGRRNYLLLLGACFVDFLGMATTWWAQFRRNSKEPPKARGLGFMDNKEQVRSYKSRPLFLPNLEHVFEFGRKEGRKEGRLYNIRRTG